VDLNTLMTDFKFTAADLEANRQGQLSPAQQASLLAKAKQIRKSCASMAFSILGIGLIFFIVLLVLNTGSLNWLNMALLVVVIGLAIAMIVFGVGVVTSVRRLIGVPVVNVRGQIQLEQDGTSLKNRKYYIRLGDQRFSVPQQAFKHFENGESYVIYVRSNSLEVLSIEPD
jgi:hypothetical protein